MIEQTLDISTAAGQMETFICHPEHGGPFPAVFLLMDAPGIRENLRDMARRLDTVGYYVLLPNLYDRRPRYGFWGGCARGGQRRARAHAGRAHQDDHSPGHGRRCRNARLHRSAERGKTGPRRMPRLLHERPLCFARGGALSGSDRRRLFLRDLARQRRGGKPASLIEQGQRGALHRLRRA
jgi:hypothetical protein